MFILRSPKGKMIGIVRWEGMLKVEHMLSDKEQQ